MTLDDIPSAPKDPLAGRPGPVCQYAHVMDRATREALGDVSALALLVVRGLLLWILIPVGFVLWLVIFGWSARVGLGTFLGWLDLNLTVALQRILVLPVRGKDSMRRAEFVPLRLMESVKHRVHIVRDPF